MGFAWNGNCYETPETALEAFSRDVPKVDASGINAFASVPSVDAAGVVSWSISNRPLSSDIATTRTGTTQLPSCSYDSFRIDQLPDIAFVVFLVFAFFMGFRSGQTA